VKVELWLCTDRVGSEVKRTIEVDDEDVEGLSEQARDGVIHEYAQDYLYQMFEWGWNIVEERSEDRGE